MPRPLEPLPENMKVLNEVGAAPPTEPDKQRELCRITADLLENLAADATPGPWWTLESEQDGVYCVTQHDDHFGEDASETVFCPCADGEHTKQADADWASTMSPSVAGPLVTWLRQQQTAEVVDQNAVAFAWAASAQWPITDD